MKSLDYSSPHEEVVNVCLAEILAKIVGEGNVVVPEKRISAANRMNFLPSLSRQDATRDVYSFSRLMNATTQHTFSLSCPLESFQ